MRFAANSIPAAASPDSGSTRRLRLKKALCHFLKGERSITSTHDAKLFLEAVALDPEPARCIETILGSTAGLHAVRQSVRTSSEKTFICDHIFPFLSYLSHPDARAICEGRLLEQLIVAIVEPPTVWKNIIRLYADENALNSNNETEAVAWLCLQIVAHPGTILAGAVEDVETALKKWPLLNRPSAKAREIGYQIQHMLRSKFMLNGVSSNTFGVEGPGGRHDNDFEDFRETQIYPTTDESSSMIRPFYRTAAEIAEIEPESRLRHHLDNQFRLLREDMLAELRDDVKSSMSQRKSQRRPVLVLPRLKLFGIDSGDQTRGQLCSLLVSISGGGLRIPGDGEAARKKWLQENPKVLRHQTFGALCWENKPLGFAFVVRDVEKLARPEPVVGLRFPNTGALGTVLTAFQSGQPLRFVVVDTPVFAYEPVLQRLKELTDLPLQDELLQLGGEGQDGIHETESPPLDRAVSLVAKRCSESSENGVKVGVGGKEYNLDAAQANALHCAITTPVSVIQGPPGNPIVSSHVQNHVYLLC